MKRRAILCVVLGVLLQLAAGCALIPNIAGRTEPKEPSVTNAYLSMNKKEFKDEHFRDKYDHYFSSYSTSRACVERNRIIYNLLAVCDIYHEDYVVQLRNGKAGKDMLTDFITLGLNAAGAVTGGEAVKGILAATSAGVVGANAAIDKDYLSNLTIQTIHTQMTASKIAVFTDIKRGMQTTNSATCLADYPLEQGLRDVFRYYQAGTLTQALTDMSQTTADAKTSNKTALDAVMNVQAPGAAGGKGAKP